MYSRRIYYKFKHIRPSCLKNVFRFYSNRNILHLREKGMIQELFPDRSAQEIIDLCNASPQCVYAGFDPTAKSLHVGNLLVLTSLLHWQRGGHQVIALVGGATGRIGDPSGRTKERDALDEETVQENSRAIVSNIRKVFDNHAEYFWNQEKPLPKLKILDNWAWYNQMNAVDFVCGLGRHFRMGQMLSRSSVASRLGSEQGMSFTEFAYQTFQAYDWLHLLNKYDCRFQIGGNDQMGNIMTGHELISRNSDKTVYGITLPLITSESGDKLGKTAKHAVWLDPHLTSAFDLYQYLVRTADSDVGRLLHLLTFIPPKDVESIITSHQANPEMRKAQKLLAEKVTLLVHGQEGLEAARNVSSVLYESDIETLSKMKPESISTVFKGTPLIEVLLQPGITVRQLAVAANCFLNQRDADRIIGAGGLYINMNRVTNPDEVLVKGVHILSNYVTLLRVGKKNFWIVKWLT